MVPARIAAISQETPTVKRFTLTPRGPLAFLPGQWVDFAVPGIAAVGGYSFTSTPRQLERCGTFDLAIRRSAHPVATWLHDKARAGDEVAVRIGGSFTYQPGDERRPLLLLAGGVGINPLLSILQHCCELAGHGGDSSSGGSGGSGSIAGPFGGPGGQPCTAAYRSSQGPGAAARLLPPHAVVLCSASVPAELAFRAELEQMQRWAGGRVRLQLHVTAPEWQGREAEWGGRWGRIGAADLRHALRWLERSRGSSCCGEEEQTAGQTQPGHEDGDSSSRSSRSSTAQTAVPPDLAVLLCGPAAMEDDMIGKLGVLGVAQQQVRFERWW